MSAPAQDRSRLEAYLLDLERVGTTWGDERRVRDAQARANRGRRMTDLHADTTAEGRGER